METHGIDALLGLVLQCKPFYLSYASEKEKVLCICQLCLNTRLLFKTINNNEFESVAKFFIFISNCSRAHNGYYKLNCCNGTCKNCKNLKVPEIVGRSNGHYNYYQYETTRKTYINKAGIEKVSKKTERVQHVGSFQYIFDQLVSAKRKYSVHRK